MNTAIYVHKSETVLTHLGSENGYLPIEGIHALAGVRLTTSPFDPEIPFDSVTLQSWAQRQARFWVSLGFNPDEALSPWQLSYELRFTNRGGGKNSRQVSLWAKTFAPQEAVALETACSLAEMLAVLCPSEYDPQLVTTKKQFERFWGKDDVAWLAEIQRAYLPRDEDQDNSQEMYHLGDWAVSPGGLREAWELLDRLPAQTWVSVGVCPTALFENERHVLSHWAGGKLAPTSQSGLDVDPQHWEARLRRWTSQVFVVRLRIGGNLPAAQWAARTFASALTDANETPLSRVSIVTPGSPQDQQVARFNWQWAGFQPWGEDLLSNPLQRFRYLNDAREVGLLAGVWG